MMTASFTDPTVGDPAVEMAYLQAVIQVYEPWTTSKTISAHERALAVRRVRYANHALAGLKTHLPHGPAEAAPHA